MPFCRDPDKVPLQKQKKKVSNQNLPQKAEITKSPVLQNSHQKKRTDVYNPGKVKRLEVKLFQNENKIYFLNIHCWLSWCKVIIFLYKFPHHFHANQSFKILFSFSQ